jgi:hypothetical protein
MGEYLAIAAALVAYAGRLNDLAKEDPEAWQATVAALKRTLDGIKSIDADGKMTMPEVLAILRDGVATVYDAVQLLITAAIAQKQSPSPTPTPTPTK